MSRRESTERRYGNARAFAEQEDSRFSSVLKLPKDVKLFKPKAGTYLLDIMPYVVGHGNPSADEGLLWFEREYWAHRSVGAAREMVICPRMTAKKACPVCDLRRSLTNDADPDDEKLIADMAPKKRQLFNVIDLREPDKGVQIWDLSYHNFGKELKVAMNSGDDDENFDEFYHLENGMTLKVMLIDDSFGGNAFIKASRVDFRPRKKQYDDDMLKKVVNLDEALVILPAEKLKAMVMEDDDDEKPAKGKKSARDEDPDDDDDQDEPKSRKGASKASRDDDDEDADDDAPRKSKKAPKDEDDGDAEEDEDRPKGRKSAWEEDAEDEDESPVRSRSGSGKKESTSARRASATEDDPEDDDEDADDDGPKKSRKPARDDDDDDVPRKSKKAPKDDDDGDDDKWNKFEDEDEAPKKSKKR